MTALGNDKGSEYAAYRRVESVLDEAVVSGALTPTERRSVRLIASNVPVVFPETDPVSLSVSVTQRINTADKVRGATNA